MPSRASAPTAARSARATCSSPCAATGPTAPPMRGTRLRAVRSPSSPVPEAAPDVDVPVLRVEDPRRFLALAAARFHRRQPETMVAVTGTAGKTSVASFTRQIWAHWGKPAAMIGTTGLVAPGRTEYGSLTTPDPVQLHRLLCELARERRDACGDGGIEPRHRPASPRRRPAGGRGVHQSRPRPHGLPSDRRALLRDEDASLRPVAAEGRAGRRLCRRCVVRPGDRRSPARPGTRC